LRDNKGFSLIELSVVLVGLAIIMASAVPFVDLILDQYHLVLAAQGLASQLQYTRMRAVSSNEPFRVRFVPAANSYQVELDNGALHAGPFVFPPGTTLNTRDGSALTFPGNQVRFLPDGSIPATGIGSAGRIKLINRSGVRVDILVDGGGMVRQTPTYKYPPPPF
jgi:prepilin-type N-terminal cleavage/methylation domain-containing protein